MFPASVAKFLGLQPVRMFFPVLGGGVVPILAIVALQGDDFTHVVCAPNPNLFYTETLLARTSKRTASSHETTIR
jgi:hypothetical protein